MQITCPTCGTSYGVNPSALGPEGRIVRCVRCKDVWHATAEAASVSAAPPDGNARHTPDRGSSDWDSVNPDAAHTNDAWENPAAETAEPPVVESPSIAADWQGAAPAIPDTLEAADAMATQPDKRWQPSFGRFGTKSGTINVGRLRLPALPSGWMPRISLPVAITGMAAVVFGLVVWRADIVRFMPQTATFFKMVGLAVNLRGLEIADVKTTMETVDGRPVVVIEGSILGITRNTVEIPRLRFVVRDVRGAEIYAWNAVLEQTALKPGEKAWFRTRLASPPAEAREIAVRFFNRRDLAAGAS